MPDLNERAESTAPDMPSWAPQNGPWCLKRWLPLPSPAGGKYVVCIRENDHEGECRDQFSAWRNNDNAVFLGEHSGSHGG